MANRFNRLRPLVRRPKVCTSEPVPAPVPIPPGIPACGCTGLPSTVESWSGGVLYETLTVADPTAPFPVWTNVDGHFWQCNPAGTNWEYLPLASIGILQNLDAKSCTGQLSRHARMGSEWKITTGGPPP